MTKKLYTIALTLALTLFSACGGSDSPSQSQSNYNEFTTPDYLEDNTPSDPCADNNESNNSFITEEYCTNKYLGLLGASSAYVKGYTGEGVRVAVIDSGVDFTNEEMKQNASSDSKSFLAFKYDENDTDGYTSDMDGARFDQIERIILAYNGGGSGYTSAPKITITGDGDGAEAVAVIKDGEVTGIYMSKRGSGYTTVNIEIDNEGTDGSGLKIEKYLFGGYDNFGHGTAVANIIAGVKNQENKGDYYDGIFSHGIAFNAKIISTRTLADNGMSFGFIERNATSYLVNEDIDVINMSFGGKYWEDADYSIYSDLIDGNTVIVVASGNDSDACVSTSADDNDSCNFPAAYPWTEDHSSLLDGRGGWIVVGAVNAEGEIEEYSTRAGLTKDNFLVANVDDIKVPTLDGNYYYFRGTSAAAPMVSGAVALLKEKYPDMDGKDIAQILFDSATDLGEPGVDDVYGHGMVNIKAAFELAESRE
jgi:subtilisin family serine protease